LTLSRQRRTAWKQSDTALRSDSRFIVTILYYPATVTENGGFLKTFKFLENEELKTQICTVSNKLLKAWPWPMINRHYN
jgi:hypothetical protein